MPVAALPVVCILAVASDDAEIMAQTCENKILHVDAEPKMCQEPSHVDRGLGHVQGVCRNAGSHVVLLEISCLEDGGINHAGTDFIDVAVYFFFGHCHLLPGKTRNHRSVRLSCTESVFHLSPMTIIFDLDRFGKVSQTCICPNIFPNPRPFFVQTDDVGFFRPVL